MTKEDFIITYENNIFYCTKNNTKWISVNGEKWYGEEKRIEELERENRLLGERCNQLLKDKGDLTDKIAELNMKIDGLEEQNSYMFDTIALQEQQIEKMKRHCNCKHRDSEGYCEVKRTYLMDLSYDGCDKWELDD